MIKFTIKELKQHINEESNAFKPVLGKNVTSDNKKNNGNYYKEVSKQAKEEKQKEQTISSDDNYGMQDLEYCNMTPEFRAKVKSQMKGYVSSDAEKKHKNDPFGNANYNDIKGFEEKSKKKHDDKIKSKTIGLTSREFDKKDFDKQNQSVYENKITVIKFKNLAFLTENHMISKIPEQYKVEGKKFIMKDKNDTTYLVEWHNNDEEPKIINESKIKEQQKRIHDLFGYKSAKNRIIKENEENNMLKLINKARKL